MEPLRYRLRFDWLGVRPGDFVITQAVSFVASCNAIHYNGAEPIFVDVSKLTFGMCPQALDEWLCENASLNAKGECVINSGKRVVRACLPMHTFGHPVNLDSLLLVCKRWHIPIVEDAAEALGSLYKGNHVGNFGKLGSLSFNGNKIVTCGGGGMILCDKETAIVAKHLTTTAKVAHQYEYVHDEVGYNYRMPNLNAALGVAQMERIDEFISAKRNLANSYAKFFLGTEFTFVFEPEHCRANYWLNAVICEDEAARDNALAETNKFGVMTRPLWRLLSNLPMYKHCMRGSLKNSEWLEKTVLNIPSGVPRCHT